MIHRIGYLLLFLTVLVAVIKTGTCNCSKDSMVYMMIAACGVSKRSENNSVHDYPIVTKKEFDSLLEKMKEKEKSLTGVDTFESILLPAQEASKDADPTENYKQLLHARETKHPVLHQRSFSPRIVSPLLARKQGNLNKSEDLLFDTGKESNRLYIRSKRSASVIITPQRDRNMEDVSDSESYFSADSLDCKDNNKSVNIENPQKLKDIEVVPFYSGNVPVSYVRKLQKRSKSTINNKNSASNQNSDLILDLNSPNNTSSLCMFKQHYLPKNKIPVKPRKPVGSYLERYHKLLNSSPVKSHDTVSLCMVMDNMSTHTFSDEENESFSLKSSYSDSELEYYENVLYKYNESKPSDVDKAIYTLPSIQSTRVAKKECKRQSNMAHVTSESSKDTTDVNKKKMCLQKRQEYGHTVSRRNVEMIRNKKEQYNYTKFTAPPAQVNIKGEDCFTRKIDTDDFSSHSKLDQKQVNNQRNATVRKNNVRNTGCSRSKKTDCFSNELSNLQKRHEEDRKRVERIRNELRI